MAAVRGIVPPAPGEAEAPDAEEVEDPQEREVIAQRLDPLEGKEDADLPGGCGSLGFRDGSNHGEPFTEDQGLLLQAGDLVEGFPQGHFG